jgi:hypothetical protein
MASIGGASVVKSSGGVGFVLLVLNSSGGGVLILSSSFLCLLFWWRQKGKRAPRVARVLGTATWGFKGGWGLRLGPHGGTDAEDCPADGGSRSGLCGAHQGHLLLAFGVAAASGCALVSWSEDRRSRW